MKKRILTVGVICELLAVLILMIGLVTYASSNDSLQSDKVTYIEDKDEKNDIVGSENEIDFSVKDNPDNQNVLFTEDEKKTSQFVFDILDIPSYSGNPYVVLNDNKPLFEDSEINTEVFELYSGLDNLGRCGVAYANLCKELMPLEERGEIGNIRPSGWQIAKYNDIIDGNYLYNRCHLIGYQLAGENSNVTNLITGTRYLNVEGMLPFENQVAEYIRSTGNHVLYRVNPIFEGDNLVASGVTMEAFSVEDNGEGVRFYVYVYNVQPGIVIDYASGDSKIDSPDVGVDTFESEKDDIEFNNEESENEINNGEISYVINTNSKKFHLPSCDSVNEMKEKNKKITTESREELIKQGYSPCQRCKP